LPQKIKNKNKNKKIKKSLGWLHPVMRKKKKS
jgi:hypothetical protein